MARKKCDLWSPDSVLCKEKQNSEKGGSSKRSYLMNVGWMKDE